MCSFGLCLYDLSKRKRTSVPEKRKADLNGVSQPETVWEAKLPSITGISYQYQEHLRVLSLRQVILQYIIFHEHFWQALVRIKHFSTLIVWLESLLLITVCTHACRFKRGFLYQKYFRKKNFDVSWDCKLCSNFCWTILFKNEWNWKFISFSVLLVI